MPCICRFRSALSDCVRPTAKILRFTLAFGPWKSTLLVTMKMQFLMIAGFGLLLAGCNRQAPAPKTDLDRFQGTWNLVSATQDGKVLPEDKVKQTTIVFKGDTFLFPGSADTPPAGLEQSSSMKRKRPSRWTPFPPTKRLCLVFTC